MNRYRTTLLLSLAIAQIGIAQAGELENRGHRILTRLGAGCHAVDKVGSSPHFGAPPFRSISDRYDIYELTERMTEQLVSTHPDMPDFRFSEDEARAARAYLYSIQRWPRD
jgi:mono/diheme cytochrome c family protein